MGEKLIKWKRSTLLEQASTTCHHAPVGTPKKPGTCQHGHQAAGHSTVRGIHKTHTLGEGAEVINANSSLVNTSRENLLSHRN